MSHWSKQLKKTNTTKQSKTKQQQAKTKPKPKQTQNTINQNKSKTKQTRQEKAMICMHVLKGAEIRLFFNVHWSFWKKPVVIHKQIPGYPALYYVW